MSWPDYLVVELSALQIEALLNGLSDSDLVVQNMKDTGDGHLVRPFLTGRTKLRRALTKAKGYDLYAKPA